MQPDVQIHPTVALRLRAIALVFDTVRVEASEAAYAELSELAHTLAQQYEGATAGAIELAAESRRLYREFGLDPTRTRPSSEALLRRALRKLPLYRISNVVDAGNLISLRWQLSLGLYDASRIVGAATVRLGGPGEGYEGIRKGWVNLQQRLCVADDEGVFGSPTSDSARTSIRDDTQRALVILFAPADGDRGRLCAAATDLEAALGRFAMAKLSARREFL